MFAKPELRITLYYYKCRLGCDVPYGIMQTSKTQAESSWMNHAFQLHRGKVTKIPPYLIKEKKFKAVKDA